MPPNCHPVKRRVCEGFEREGEPKRSAERVVKVQQEVASKDVEGCCHHGTRNSSWKFRLQKINVAEMVYGLAKLAVDSREVQVNENEVEAVIYDGGTMSARAACERYCEVYCG
ncbi:hypothetical protein B0H13DRAFT_2265445 [Mycena leptocephala]|nr:hypothetical protein B0H13DRAFT_2265445 [Mycena leptocephala]